MNTADNISDSNNYDSQMVEKRWYAKLFENLKDYSSRNPVFFLFLLLMLPVTIFAIQTTLSLFSKAAVTNTVNLAFSPSSLPLTGNSNIKIMLESQNGNIGFARVVFSFDKTKIKLTSEITTNPLLSTVVEKTTMAQANTDGTAKIVLALPPSGQAPVGNFEFASFSIDAVAGNIGSTQLSFTAGDVQVVNLSQTILTPNITNLNINEQNISPTNSVSATVIPTVSSVVSPSITPIISTTPTQSVSSTPAPTLTPSATHSGEVQVKFSSSSLNLPPPQTVKIVLDSYDRKVAFARVDFSFEPTKVNLTAEIRTNPGLSTIVAKTSMHAANIAGKASIILAASPTDVLPGGAFDFVELTLTGLSQNIGRTSINIDPATIQIVDSATHVLTPRITNLGINGEIIVTPTPTVYQSNPNACTVLTSPSCLAQWIREFAGVFTTKITDLNHNGKVELQDFEIIRKAVYP